MVRLQPAARTDSELMVSVVGQQSHQGYEPLFEPFKNHLSTGHPALQSQASGEGGGGPETPSAPFRSASDRARNVKVHQEGYVPLTHDEANSPLKTQRNLQVVDGRFGRRRRKIREFYGPPH